MGVIVFVKLDLRGSLVINEHVYTAASMDFVIPRILFAFVRTSGVE